MTSAEMSDERSLWPVGIVLFVGALLAIPVLVRVGLPLWGAPLISTLAFAWAYIQPDYSVLGVTLRRLRKLLIWLLIFAMVQAVVLWIGQVKEQDRIADEKVQAAAQEIVTVGKSDPAKQAELLAKADIAVLAALSDIDLKLFVGEMARRDAATAEANAPRIAELLARERKLDRSDFDGRIQVWKSLVSLAPGEEAYKTTLRELERIRANPVEGVEVVNMNWRKDGFGSVMMLDITLRNDSGVVLRDFVINCEHSGPSGTIMDRNSRTLYETLAAGERRRFRNVNMGFILSQATASSCRVDGAKVG